MPLLLMPVGTMDFAADLPAYSDRIAQDLHLIPFYPDGLPPPGTEKCFYSILATYYTTPYLFCKPVFAGN